MKTSRWSYERTNHYSYCVLFIYLLYLPAVSFFCIWRKKKDKSWHNRCLREYVFDWNIHFTKWNLFRHLHINPISTPFEQHFKLLSVSKISNHKLLNVIINLKLKSSKWIQ